MLTFDPHPELHPTAFLCEFPRPLGALDPGELLAHWFIPTEQGGLPSPGPIQLGDHAREALRQDVRDLLRHGGHKPTGRGKPSAEYLVKARAESRIPSINVAVDACNAASVHSGLPISVIDLDRAAPPFSVRVPDAGDYVFNASGQTIGLAGLLCLADANGPIANAVKDSHGTKTQDATRRTLSILWCPRSHQDHGHQTMLWYRDLLESAGGARTMALDFPMPPRAAETLLAMLLEDRSLPMNEDVTRPVPILHELRFPDPEAAALSTEAMEMMGFRPVSSSGAAHLRLERTDEPNLPCLFRAVMHLKELSAPYDGDHVGWTLSAAAD